MGPLFVIVQRDGRIKIATKVTLPLKQTIIIKSHFFHLCFIEIKKIVLKMNLSNENDKFTVFVDKNECLLSPCQNNGTCINSIGSYQCNCEAGWQDKDCEQGIRMFHIPLCFVYMYKDIQRYSYLVNVIVLYIS